MPHGLVRQSHLEEAIETHTGRVTVILLCTEEFSCPLEAVLLDETHYNAAVVGGTLLQYQNTKIKVLLHLKIWIAQRDIQTVASKQSSLCIRS